MLFRSVEGKEYVLVESALLIFESRCYVKHCRGPFARSAHPFSSRPLLKNSGTRISRNNYRCTVRSTVIDVNLYSGYKLYFFFPKFVFSKKLFDFLLPNVHRTDTNVQKKYSTFDHEKSNNFFENSNFGKKIYNF